MLRRAFPLLALVALSACGPANPAPQSPNAQEGPAAAAPLGPQLPDPSDEPFDPVAIGMSNVSLPRFTLLNALGAVLWAAALAVLGYLLGNVLELVLGDLAAVEKPLLIGIVILAALWIVHRHVSDHAARAKPGPEG